MLGMDLYDDMSDHGEERIAHTLGQILGKLDSLNHQFENYVVRHDERHDKIDAKLEDHAAQMNQAKGAKGAILALAGVISGTIAYIVKKLIP